MPFDIPHLSFRADGSQKSYYMLLQLTVCWPLGQNPAGAVIP